MSVSPVDAAFVRDLVYRRSAIKLDEAKQYLIETRLGTLAHEAGYGGDVATLIGHARAGRPGMETKIVEAITTHETSFFRDFAPFEELRKTVLPKLIAARQAMKTLTIWSAACSSGQEPYSLAILLREHFPELAGWKVRVLATDLSNQILARAATGTFTQLEVNRGLPVHYLLKYFDKAGRDWTVKPAVRELVTFSQLNLLEQFSPAPRPDVILLRNVLIYFDLSVRKTILQRMRTVLAPDGYLILGTAETTMNIDDGWTQTSAGNVSFYQGRP